MLAINNDAGYIGSGNACVKEFIARLRLAVWRKKRQHIVNSAICHLCRERKGSVPGDKEVVTRIVLQLESVARTLDKTYDRSTDGETRLRAYNFDVGDVPFYGTGAVHHSADLGRGGRLGQDCNRIGGPDGNRRRKREWDVPRAGNLEVVRSIVL
jgi:hypothetical protein